MQKEQETSLTDQAASILLTLLWFAGMITVGYLIAGCHVHLHVGEKHFHDRQQPQEIEIELPETT